MLTPLKAWLWLTLTLDTGPAWQIMHHFASPEQAYFADEEEYALVPRLTEANRKKLANKSLEEAEQVLADCDRLGISILTWQDADYPERLRNIDLPPLVLYYRGTLFRFDDEIAIAMAGTRKATPYGRKVSAELAFQITRLGGLVLTGIVGGCDRFSVDGALKAGGPLVAVVAGGVDLPYYNDEENRRLMDDIAAVGMIVSQRAPGTPHLGEYFASRNALLTGLALGTVCVEAPPRSGTLNVARLALDAGRDVYAVPANIDAPAAGGTNQLLVRGEAICVCSGADILTQYWSLYPHRRKQAEPLTQPQQAQRLQSNEIQEESPPVQVRKEKKEVTAPPRISDRRMVSLKEHASEFTDDEQLILRALMEEPLVTDLLVSRTGLPARRVSATLTVLTIRGLVCQLPGGRFEATIELK